MSDTPKLDLEAIRASDIKAVDVAMEGWRRYLGGGKLFSCGAWDRIKARLKAPAPSQAPGEGSPTGDCASCGHPAYAGQTICHCPAGGPIQLRDKEAQDGGSPASRLSIEAWEFICEILREEIEHRKREVAKEHGAIAGLHHQSRLETSEKILAILTGDGERAPDRDGGDQ